MGELSGLLYIWGHIIWVDYQDCFIYGGTQRGKKHIAIMYIRYKKTSVCIPAYIFMCTHTHSNTDTCLNACLVPKNVSFVSQSVSMKYNERD